MTVVYRLKGVWMVATYSFSLLCRGMPEVHKHHKSSHFLTIFVKLQVSNKRNIKLIIDESSEVRVFTKTLFFKNHDKYN